MMMDLVTRLSDSERNKLSLHAKAVENIKKICAYKIAGANITLYEIEDFILNTKAAARPQSWINKASETLKDCFQRKNPSRSANVTWSRSLEF